MRAYYLDSFKIKVDGVTCPTPFCASSLKYLAL